MANDERWVGIASAASTIQLEMWRDLLEQEGIPSQVPGLRHSQALGGILSANVLNVEIRVRVADAERARDLLESLDLGEPIDEEYRDGDSEPPPRLESDGGKGPYRADARPPAARSGTKSALTSVAVGLCLSFGAAHFYAGEVYSGVALALAQLGALALLVTGQTAGAIALVLVIAIDIGSGRNALNRANAGDRLTARGQLARTVPLVLAVALAAALMWRTGPPR